MEESIEHVVNLGGFVPNKEKTEEDEQIDLSIGEGDK